MRLMIVGATGLVGGHLLAQALDDDRVARVIAPTRRALAPHPKLVAPVVDFDALPADADWWAVDAVACALGTTMRQAGSQQAFRRVDHDYPLAIARAARARGATAFVLNSAIGADSGSRFFYNRVKGDVEAALRALGFPSLTLVRPGLIGGTRAVARPLEHAGAVVLGAVGWALPRRMRLNPAPNIACAMLEAALAAAPGIRVVDAADLC